MKFVNHREFREHVKDLSCLIKDLCRLVLVDNNPFSFLLQPLNGLPCISFSAGGHSSSPPTPFSTEGCEACTL